jgi:hypothetical protein
MNIHDFRRLALSLPGAEESSHMGSPDFRVGGRIFATLAAAKLGYGNIMITPEQQAAFVAELPEAPSKPPTNSASTKTPRPVRSHHPQNQNRSPSPCERPKRKNPLPLVRNATGSAGLP